MALIEIARTTRLDGPIQPEGLTGVLYTTENIAHQFVISCTRNGADVALSGTVTGKFIRSADNATVPLTGSISNGKAYVTLNSSCYLYNGHFDLSIFVTENSAVTCVYAAAGHVRRTDGETTIDPSGEITIDVNTLLTAIETATASIPADYSDLLATIANTFSSSANYPSSAYAWYDGTLYTFPNGHPAGSWVGTDAVAVVIANNISTLREGLENLVEKGQNLIPAKAAIQGFNGVVVTYKNGHVNVTGTADNSGGRTRSLAEVTLPAGTYTARVHNVDAHSKAYPEIFVQDKSDNSIIASVGVQTPADATITLAAQKTVFIGVNVVDTREYDSDFDFQLEAGSSSTAYMPPFGSATDYYARADVADLKSRTDAMPTLKESDTDDVDLDVSDPSGNVILRLADGHIETKNFDSADMVGVSDAVAASPMLKNSSATGVNLDVSDNAGNVLLRLQDGHIKVKNFDSSELATTISGIEEDIAEIEEIIEPTLTSVTVNTTAGLLDEIANGTSDIILIKNGTYSVLNVEVTRNVQIVGESRTGVVLNCDGTTDQVNPVTDRHGIRFQKGGALKNLTFNVNDVKYVMHQDSIAVGYDLLVENCTFNRYDDSCGYYFFIGCGCYGTQDITVKNCSFIFSNNTHNRVSYGIFWHNWHLAKSQLNALAANVTIENCGCVGCGIIIVTDLASKDVNDIISVLNCYSTEAAPISSTANGYYLDIPNTDVPYNVLFIINCKIGNMILADRSASQYAYLGAVVTNFTT